MNREDAKKYKEHEEFFYEGELREYTLRGCFYPL